MGLFTRKPSALDVVSSQLTSLQNNLVNLTNRNAALEQTLLQTQFRMGGGFIQADTANETGYITNGYQLSSAVYSITSLIARKAAGIPMKCYEIKDDNALKAYKRIKLDGSPKALYKSMKLRQKAMVEVQQDNPIQAIIDRPNRVDNTTTFYEMGGLFRLLTGNKYWYAPTLDKGSDKGKVIELFTMPSNYVLLYITKNVYPSQVIGYELIINGIQLLNTTEVIHSVYPNPYWTTWGQEHYGMSPLKAGARTLKRANDSETAGIAQLENGGPAVIIANKSVSSDDFGVEQIGKSKQQFQREYAGVVNKAKVKMMAGDISVQSLGITPVELDLIAGEQWNFAMICNLYHVSDTLFNNHAASTESNVKEMRKDSYTSAIIPERQSDADMFNTRIVPGYNGKGRKFYVDLDLSGIQELQPDMTALAQWLNTSWWVTPNEKREMQDFGKSEDESMDKIWMPSGLVTMEDMSIQVDPLNDPAQEDAAV